MTPPEVDRTIEDLQSLQDHFVLDPEYHPVLGFNKQCRCCDRIMKCEGGASDGLRWLYSCPCGASTVVNELYKLAGETAYWTTYSSHVDHTHRTGTVHQPRRGSYSPRSDRQKDPVRKVLRYRTTRMVHPRRARRTTRPRTQDDQ